MDSKCSNIIYVPGCVLRVSGCELRVACFELRVASCALRGEIQTNPKSAIQNPKSEGRFPGLGSFQIFFLLFFLFGRNQLFQVFNKINGNLILGISELIRHLGDD